jgi:hypothetical protein
MLESVFQRELVTRCMWIGRVSDFTVPTRYTVSSDDEEQREM